MRLGKRETISRRARRPRTQRLTPMPTPSPLPQRSRTTPLSRRSSIPNRNSPQIAHSPHPLVSPFRMNTCKSVSKQSTLTIFRMNTYAKPGGRGSHPSVLCSLHVSTTSYPHSPIARNHPSHVSIALGHAALPGNAISELALWRSSTRRQRFSFWAIAVLSSHQQGGIHVS